MRILTFSTVQSMLAGENLLLFWCLNKGTFDETVNQPRGLVTDVSLIVYLGRCTAIDSRDS